LVFEVKNQKKNNKKNKKKNYKKKGKKLLVPGGFDTLE